MGDTDSEAEEVGAGGGQMRTRAEVRFEWRGEGQRGRGAEGQKGWGDLPGSRLLKVQVQGRKNSGSEPLWQLWQLLIAE